MTIKLNEEIAAFLAAAGRSGQVPAPPVTDVASLRASTEEGLRTVFARMPPAPSVRMTFTPCQ